MSEQNFHFRTICLQHLNILTAFGCVPDTWLLIVLSQIFSTKRTCQLSEIFMGETARKPTFFTTYFDNYVRGENLLKLQWGRHLLLQNRIRYNNYGKTFIPRENYVIFQTKAFIKKP